MALLAVVAFQGDRLALALIMAADRQHQWVDDITVGAEQAHLPAGEALEQPPEGPFVAALPVNQAPGCAVVGRPDPHLVCLALQEVPHLIEFDHHRLARRRLAAVMIDIAAHPAQHRLRRSRWATVLKDKPYRLTAARLVGSGVPCPSGRVNW